MNVWVCGCVGVLGSRHVCGVCGVCGVCRGAGCVGVWWCGGSAGARLWGCVVPVREEKRSYPLFPGIHLPVLDVIVAQV